MVYCPNCKQTDCVLLKDRNGKLYQLEDNLDLNMGDDTTNYGVVLYTTYVCNICGNLFAIGEMKK